MEIFVKVVYVINLLPKKQYLNTIRYGLLHNYGFVYILYMVYIYITYSQGTYEEKEPGKNTNKLKSDLISFIHTDSLFFRLKRLSLVPQKLLVQ